MALKIADVKVGDKGWLFLNEPSKRLGKEITVEVMDIRDTNVLPLKDSRTPTDERSQFLLKFKTINTDKEEYLSAYCRNIQAFVKGWGTVETFTPQ